MMLRRTQRGQVTVEYAVVFGMVIAGLLAVALYLRRGVQGGLKGSSDSFGTQFQSDADWSAHSRSANIELSEKTGSSQYTKTCQGLGGTTKPDCAPPDDGTTACTDDPTVCGAPFDALTDAGFPANPFESGP